MAANTLNDLFRHGLGDIYDAEQQIVSVLDQMETETGDQEVRNRIRKHREETQKQIQNLEHCFELLGSEPSRVQCSTVRGLRDEKRSFQQEGPSPLALEIFNLDAANKTEHYEIASYRGLVDLARALEQDDMRRLLEQNLHQEETMSAWLEQQQPKLLSQARTLRTRAAS
ncbi:MAG: ferritin-like domain-containing protein [Gemmatimonadetes bacterium]|nr:ferritin-like domain-containing protein [Gemmatimonadota bacterium]